MTPTKKPKPALSPEVLAPSGGPLVFISHDGRDAELAEAFGKLLKSVSAGMIKTFRSSDKKGTDGIDFGEEWYKRLMTMLQTTSDVVCLFTERSVDRPWILFEAGVAKGRLSTPVVGLALGIPLRTVSTGPFYQFQNMDDSEGDLTKLVHQLARRVPGVELDVDVVKVQVGVFKSVEADILKKMNTPGGKKGTEGPTDENSVAKLAEEMKALPSRVAERLEESGALSSRRRGMRRFHPAVMEDMMRLVDGPGDPVSILILASMFRDEVPWLYEVMTDAYRAIKTGDADVVEAERERVARVFEYTRHSPLPMDLYAGGKEEYMYFRECMSILDHAMSRALEQNAVQPRRRQPRAQPEQK